MIFFLQNSFKRTTSYSKLLGRARLSNLVLLDFHIKHSDRPLARQRNFIVKDAAILSYFPHGLIEFNQFWTTYKVRRLQITKSSERIQMRQKLGGNVA